MNYGRFASYEDFLKELEQFHGKMAPGGVLGLQMVNLAWELLPPGIEMDVICETRKCLTDAIQLLTPCTVGNHWLKVVDTGRFAAVFYDKRTGEGIRISLSTEKLKNFPVIHDWFFKLTPKKDQSLEAILGEICRAGYDILDHRPVQVDPQVFKPRDKTPPVVCPICGEAYPPAHGDRCRGCQGVTDGTFR